MRIAASVVFVAIFVPISLYRRLAGSSRFGSDYHHGATAWDKPDLARPRP